MTEVVRIAMWSGPRNISTAMMRAWDARGDAFVSDEPLYANYLRETGLDHPGAAEVIAHHDADWRSVVRTLTGPVPNGAAIWYQKHMAHHVLPGMDLAWAASLRNVFLIREPREMLTSLLKVLPNATVEETGLPQQVALFDAECARTNQVPPVIDGRDVLDAPGPMLERLCAALDVPYTERMLTWTPGRRATDGIWARHWYGAVEQSTGFAPYRPKEDAVPTSHRDVLEACEALYARLRPHRLIAS